MLSRRPLSRLAARLSPRRAALSTAADEYTPEYTTSPGPLSDPSEFHSVEHLHRNDSAGGDDSGGEPQGWWDSHV